MSETAIPDQSETGPKPGSIAFYAREYEADERTVKRWKAKGRDNRDETPLEDPEAMRAWWSRNMKQRIPLGIDEAVRRWRLEGKSNPAPAPPAIAPVDAAPAPLLELPAIAPPPLAEDKVAERRQILDQPISPDEIGTEQTLQRLLEMEVRLSRLATDPGQAKPWLDTIARISPMVEKLRREDEAQRKLIPRADAETMIHEYHAPIERETRQLYRTMCELSGIPIIPHTEALWNKECDRLFARFQGEVLR